MCNIQTFNQLFILSIQPREGLSVPDAPESFSHDSDEEIDEDEEENKDCSPGPSMTNDPDYDQESSFEPQLIT